MTTRVDPELSMRMATDIVVAYLEKASVDPKELPQLVLGVRRALTRELEANLSAGRADVELPVEADGRAEPAVPVEASVTDEFIISLEDGKPYRSLKRHLMAKHGLTPEAYRQKWGLPDDYPMVAPSYAKARSAVAKRIGLGRAKA